MLRLDIANLIIEKLEKDKKSLVEQFYMSKDSTGFFIVDDLLPNDLALKANNLFPDDSEMVVKKSLKEYKYISAQMDNHNELLEEILYAFQDKRIVKLIQEICGFEVKIEPDISLYAGGLSLMKKDCFLNPHLDNSHDNNRNKWRVLNLLYYVTPDWEIKFGGNLEIWPNGPKAKPIELESKFNRLIVMQTHNESWHSVNKIKVDKERKCISNYYFSNEPLSKNEFFHVTSFKGRPNERIRNFLLSTDNKLRMGIRKVFKKGIRKNPHVYKRKN